MSSPTISLCMIVKNEEDFLEQCLKSVESVVSEIIIVDTGSTDSTLQIAERHNAKILHYNWNGDFAAARNYSIQHATSDYILVLDADEYLPINADLQADIRTENDFYLVRIKNHMGNGLAIYHSAVRLFKNRVGLEYKGRIHEHLNIEEPCLNLSSQNANTVIQHLGYLKNVYDKRNKHERNINLLLRAVEENPTGYNYFNLGMQYKMNEEYISAFETLKKSFSLSKEKIYITSLIYHMADCLLHLKRYDEGLRLVRDAIDSFPNYTDLHFLQGKFYEQYGYWKDAENAYRKCLELGNVEVLQTIDGVGSYLANYSLGTVLLQQGEKILAMEAAFHSVRENKHFLPAIVLYLKSVDSARIPEEVVYETLKKIYPITEVDDLKSLLTGLYSLRHPLLIKLLNEYSVNVESFIHAVAKQYAGLYSEAMMEWDSLDQLQPENTSDVLVLSMILGDTDLLAKLKNSLNLNQREWKVLFQLIRGENLDNQKITSSLEKLLLDLCDKLLITREFEVLHTVLKQTEACSEDLQLKILRLLYSRGHSEMTLPTLLEMFEKEPTNPDVIELIGDFCLFNNNVTDALTLYTRLLELKNDYSSYLRVYRLYQIDEDLKGMQTVKKEMAFRFPLSVWASTAVGN